MGGSGEGAEGARVVRYLLVPGDLADGLHDLLRRHFREDSTVEVIVERRGRDRRRTPDRRVGSNAEHRGPERRSSDPAGRRIAERRAAAAAVDVPELPRKARPYGDRLVFIERIEQGDERREDADTARLVMRIQAGERELSNTLYVRYFDRVYSYVRVMLRSADEAEDATQQVFENVLDALPRYERRSTPFRGWLFTIARNETIKRLQAGGRQTPVEPQELDRYREREPDSEAGLRALDWITDSDLMLFVERLPLAQRQVLLLRYMHDLPYAQIAAILDRTPNDVRKNQQRAIAFLRARLSAVGRDSREARRSHWRRRPTFLGVARARRFALLP